MSTLGAAVEIARLRNGAELACHRYRTDERYRMRVNAEELAQAMFESNLAKGLISRPKPRAEWLDWPTDRSTA